MARRPLARLSAAMLGWIGLDADDRYLRLASALFALTGATWTIGGICFTTISAFHVTPA